MVRQVANHLERGRGGLMAVVVVYPDGSVDGGAYCDAAGVPAAAHIASTAMLRQLAEAMDKSRVPLGGVGHG